MMQEILDIFPPQNDKDLFDILQFVKKSPFAKDYWKVLKSLYKQSEEILTASKTDFDNSVANILGNLLYRIDQEKLEDLQSPYPTKATLAYMKRRGRRFLRNIADKNPDLYFMLASKIILANEGKSNLDFDNQWISLDIILGKSNRCHQLSNGRGKYVFANQKYHLHQREEREPQIWNQQISFVSELLHKEMPWEIYEFAARVLSQNQIALPDIREDILVKFFNSPSYRLKRTATTLSYKTFTSRGLKPAVFAGMWLYCNAGLKKKIAEIDEKRPKKDKIWYQEFAKFLSHYTINELKEGNNSRRVVTSVDYLQKEYPDFINKENILPIAAALFHSKAKSLQELAFLGASAAKKEDALKWLLALENGKDKLDIPMYERLAALLLMAFKESRLNRVHIEPYVYNPSFAVCDFGWRLSSQIQYEYELYNIWYNLGQYERRRRMKEVYFLNSISSSAGADAFLRYFGRNQYSLNYFPDKALALIFQKANKRIVDFVIKQFTKNFKSEPLYNLQKISLLPVEIRDKIFENSLESFVNKELFHYQWYVRNAFYAAQTDEWITKALFKIIEVSKLSIDIARNIISEAFEIEGITAKFFDFVNQMPAAKRNIFVSVLSEYQVRIMQTANHIPADLLKDSLEKAGLDTLLQIISLATEENWKAMSEVIYEQLLRKEQESGFWKEILNRILAAETNILQLRLLDDEKFYHLFQNQKDTSIIDVSEPEFEEVLLGWVSNNPQIFEMESSELLKICIHKLPKIRFWGLETARNKGISLVFGLQLLESDLPDAVQEAKNYFNTLKPNSTDELDAVLALCDSPNKAVRAFGMDFLLIRKENFPKNTQVLEFLSEHADSIVQEFVAKEISENQLDKDFVKRFDKEILRMKNRSRKAKEKVKERIKQTLQIEVSTLLELAKSGSKGDAEWAIEQLTKKALAGEEVKGFELS